MYRWQTWTCEEKLIVIWIFKWDMQSQLLYLYIACGFFKFIFKMAPFGYK